jgi:hypothetical protein
VSQSPVSKFADGFAMDDRFTLRGCPSVYLDTLRNKNVETPFQDTQSGSLPMQLPGTWAPLIWLGVL